MIQIVIDSREKLPFKFEKYDVLTEGRALEAGDYSLAGFEDKIGIERKGLDDLVACLMGSNRVRFEKELARGRHYEFFSVVIEGSYQDVFDHRYTSQMTPSAVLQSIVAFHLRYGISFLFAGSRQAAEYLTYSLLSKYCYEIERRFHVMQKAVDNWRAS